MPLFTPQDLNSLIKAAFFHMYFSSSHFLLSRSAGTGSSTKEKLIPEHPISNPVTKFSINTETRPIYVGEDLIGQLRLLRASISTRRFPSRVFRQGLSILAAS